MAKKRTKKNSKPKFLGWLFRHKVFMGFVALVLVLVVSTTTLAVTREVQAHIEAQRFSATAGEMLKIKAQLAKLNPTKLMYDKSCQRSSNGAIFENYTTYCNTGVTSVYFNLDTGARANIIEATKKALENEGLMIHQDSTNRSDRGIASYAFNYQHISCYFDAWYYDQSTPSYERDSSMPLEGTETKTQIYCGGKTIKSYFPVVNS